MNCVNQQGMILVLILALVLIISIFSLQTLFVTRTELIEAGEEKRQLQSFLAAEAGVARIVRELNWDHYWARQLPAWQAGDNQIDHADFLDTLDSQWGQNPLFKVYGIRVLNLIPDIDEILVDGGFDRNRDSLIDQTDKTTLRVKLRLGALSDFFRFVENNSTLSYAGGARIEGKVYTGGDLQITGNDVVFERHVKSGGSLILTSGVTDTSSIKFQKGITTSSNWSLSMNHVHIDSNDTDGPAPVTYRGLARGKIDGHGTGLEIPDSLGKTVLLNLDQVVRNANGTVTSRIYDANDSTRYTDVTSDSVKNFNGVIYANADILVKGTLKDVSLTLASSDDIIARDSILCTGNEYNAKDPVTLGLIAQDQFFVHDQSPSYLKVEASVIAENDEITDVGYEYSHSETSGWEALGGSTTHPILDYDQDGNLTNSDKGNWKLVIQGSIVTRLGGSAGIWASKGTSTHHSREYLYDDDLYYNPPPEFPLIEGVIGAPVWEIISWQEL